MHKGENNLFFHHRHYCCPHKKIARSRYLGILATGQCCQDVKNGEKVTYLCFYVLDRDHECYKSSLVISHTISITPSNTIVSCSLPLTPAGEGLMTAIHRVVLVHHTVHLQSVCRIIMVTYGCKNYAKHRVPIEMLGSNAMYHAIYCSLTKKGPWAVYLKLGSNRGVGRHYRHHYCALQNG